MTYYIAWPAPELQLHPQPQTQKKQARDAAKLPQHPQAGSSPKPRAIFVQGGGCQEPAAQLPGCQMVHQRTCHLQTARGSQSAILEMLLCPPLYIFIHSQAHHPPANSHCASLDEVFSARTNSRFALGPFVSQCTNTAINAPTCTHSVDFHVP